MYSGLWNRATSVYETALESTGYRQEGIVDVEWDPIASHGVLATVTSRGNVCIWRKTETEHWSAYAPGFIEIDENVVYDEKEDEFGIILFIHLFIHLFIYLFKFVWLFVFIFNYF